MKQILIVLMLLCFLSRTIVSAELVGSQLFYLIHLAVEISRCFLIECCDGRWIPQYFSRLKPELDQYVFGQHIAVKVVSIAVAGHIENPNPEKALVLSFHGSTGCGKNYVSRIVADNLYKLGMDSKYTHQIIATHDFPHKGRLAEYKDKILQHIVKKVKECEKTLFIFDEVDKVPAGLLDVLRPFLEHHEHVDGVDYRKCIFIFLSNTGAKLIDEFVFNHWQNGKKREDITIHQMKQIINNGAFNSDSGFWHSELILSNSIDYFVPFLPLEKIHVEQCIQADLKRKGKVISPDIIKRIADEMHYSSNTFSTTGCKRISSRVDLHAT